MEHKVIRRELKSHTWEFDEETRELTITRYVNHDLEPYKQRVVLDRVRMFSLMRFMIRVAQRLPIVSRKEFREKARQKRETYRGRRDRYRERIDKWKGRAKKRKKKIKELKKS